MKTIIKQLGIVILIAASMLSCEKSNRAGENLYYMFYFRLVDNNGNNLADSPLYRDSIEIYKKYSDGCNVLDDGPSIFSPDSNGIGGYFLNVAPHPRGHYITENCVENGFVRWNYDQYSYTDGYEVAFMPTIGEPEAEYTIYIKWNSNDIDTMIVKNFVSRLEEVIYDEYDDPLICGSTYTYDTVIYNGNIASTIPPIAPYINIYPERKNAVEIKKNIN